MYCLDNILHVFVPQNYPLLMMSWKVAPAIAAGCCIVVKPSEFTPMTALELTRLVCYGVITRVLNVRRIIEFCFLSFVPNRIRILCFEFF